jgi:hypothetical protein
VELRDGLRGFMITCAADKEKRCVKDCFNILNDALEKTHLGLEVEEILLKHNEAREASKIQKTESTTHNDLDEEIAALKHNTTKVWYAFDTGTPGVIFIKMLDCFKLHIDIHKISDFVVSEVQKGEVSARFICRFIPVSFLCKASGNSDEFKRLATPVIQNLI